MLILIYGYNLAQSIHDNHPLNATLVLLFPILYKLAEIAILCKIFDFDQSVQDLKVIPNTNK